jgi:hypothetical protein
VSELAKLAKERNWSKYRLLGSNFPSQGLTLSELAELEEVKSKILDILRKWDERSMQLNLVPKKKKQIANENNN